jgi:hypothetical protein
VKGPVLGGRPEVTSSNSETGRQQCTPPGPASSATRWDTGQKAAPHLACCQDPVHNVARMDTGGSTALLCLHEVGQSPIPIPTRLKTSQTSWAED